MCYSTEHNGGWTFAGTFTFNGRIHERCFDLYQKTSQIMWELYHDADGKMIEASQEEPFEGFAPVLESLGVPRAPGGWDNDHYGFKIWLHCVRNMGKMFEMRRQS